MGGNIQRTKQMIFKRIKQRKIMKAAFLKLNQNDFVKAFWMFLISTIISVVGDAVLQEVNNGVYSLSAIHWNEIGAAVLVSVVTYLKKNLLENSNGQILKKDAVQG
jgi:uncharacterized membrane-anchored protein